MFMVYTRFNDVYVATRIFCGKYSKIIDDFYKKLYTMREEPKTEIKHNFSVGIIATKEIIFVECLMNLLDLEMDLNDERTQYVDIIEYVEYDKYLYDILYKEYTNRIFCIIHPLDIKRVEEIIQEIKFVVKRTS